jgi:phosphate starvation-inducible protein PhoH
MARVKVSVGNDLATELGGDRDAVLHELAERTGAAVYLRGNELTLEGEDPAVERAKAMVTSCPTWSRRASRSARRRLTRWPGC